MFYIKTFFHNFVENHNNRRSYLYNFNCVMDFLIQRENIKNETIKNI